MAQNIPGNYYDKYHSKNPISRMLMNGFFERLSRLLKSIQVSNVLDAGCGEGEVTNFINENLAGLDTIKGIELEKETVIEANRRFPHLDISQGSIYDLGFEDNSFDLVIACEVLEHLEKPENALMEVLRVSKRYVLLSVPKEPIWRVLNMTRGKYIRQLGNTPGHIQHWSKKQFIRFIEPHAKIVEVSTPFPWTMVLLEKRVED